MGIDAPGAKVPLVIAAHFGGTVTPWLGGDYAELLVVPALASLGAVIVAPDAGTAQGWSDVDESRVMWLAKEIQRVYPIDPGKVVMTGYSAGGAQTWQVANRNQDFFTAVIPMSARPRSTGSAWRIPAYVIHSRDDELIPVASVESYVAEQQAAGARMQLHSFRSTLLLFKPVSCPLMTLLPQQWIGRCSDLNRSYARVSRAPMKRQFR